MGCFLLFLTPPARRVTAAGALSHSGSDRAPCPPANRRARTTPPARPIQPTKIWHSRASCHRSPNFDWQTNLNERSRPMNAREPFAIERHIRQTNLSERSRRSQTLANGTRAPARAISVVLTREMSVFGGHLRDYGPVHVSFDVSLASVRENCSRASRSVWRTKFANPFGERRPLFPTEI